MHKGMLAELVLVHEWTGRFKSVENCCVWTTQEPKYIRGYEASRKRNYIQGLGLGLNWPNLPDDPNVLCE